MTLPVLLGDLIRDGKLLWFYCPECYRERDIDPGIIPLPPNVPVPEIGKHMKCSAFLALFSAMAERERERVIQRTKEGRRLAMRNGVKMGPPFKLTAHQRQLAAKRLAAGESTRHVARSRRGCEVVAIYKDAGISGATGRDGRPGFRWYVEGRVSAQVRRC
jgi:hypothetical protein